MRKNTKKYLLASIIGSSLMASASVSAEIFDEDIGDIGWEPGKTYWEKLIDRAGHWVRKYGTKSEDSDDATYVFESPNLSQWRAATANWQPGACLSSRASNSGVWLNDVKEKYSKSGEFPTYTELSVKSSSYKQYKISANTPYEIESKNFKRAGLKRFADFHYSYRIDQDKGSFWGRESTVIDNKDSHDYDAIHTFSQGTSWVNSTTFSDFQWYIGYKSGDLNYLESWSNFSVKANVRVGWGTDIYISDCGFAEVISERNTKPTINRIGQSQTLVSYNGGGPEIYALDLYADASDWHTSSDHLTYTWKVDGRTAYGKRASFGVGPMGYLMTIKRDVTLTVSDGDLSTVYRNPNYSL